MADRLNPDAIDVQSIFDGSDADATTTPIGYVPDAGALDLSGLDLAADALAEEFGSE